MPARQYSRRSMNVSDIHAITIILYHKRFSQLRKFGASVPTTERVLPNKLQLRMVNICAFGRARVPATVHVKNVCS